MSTKELFEAAHAAMAKSHSPYSGFPVGAAIRTEDGRIFAGCNIENASFPEGWCAETTALGHYVMGGGGRITDILVTAANADFVTPCGGCRQRLAEFAGRDAKLHMADRKGKVKTLTMGEILPHGFKGEILL